MPEHIFHLKWWPYGEESVCSLSPHYGSLTPNTSFIHVRGPLTLPDLRWARSAGSQWCSQHFLDWHRGKVWQPDLQKRRKDTKSDICATNPKIRDSGTPNNTNQKVGSNLQYSSRTRCSARYLCGRGNRPSSYRPPRASPRSARSWLTASVDGCCSAARCRFGGLGTSAQGRMC